MKEYELGLEKVIRELKRRRAKEVTLQFPEGLKTQAVEIAREFGGFDVTIAIDPCYGACDLAAGKNVVHFGHSDMGLGRAIYVPMHDRRSPEAVAKKAIPLLKGTVGLKGTAGLVATIQHVKWLPKVKKLLEAHGLKARIGQKGGQVLGCEWSAATDIKADCYLYIGSGRFHPLGVAVATGKPVISADPLSGTVKVIDEEIRRHWARRAIAIDRARQAKTFGILVSTKPGQKRTALARRLKKELETAGKEVLIFTGNELSPQNLLGLKVDCLVNTACPRLIDDSANYSQNLISPAEVDVVLGKKSWDELTKG